MQQQQSERENEHKIYLESWAATNLTWSCARFAKSTQCVLKGREEEKKFQRAERYQRAGKGAHAVVFDYVQ